MHKMEMRVKDSGEQEEELVVSNTRPFSLKVGVHDANDRPLLDFSLPLRATLLYENGLPVKQATPAATRQTQPVAPRCITHEIRAPGPIPDPRRPPRADLVVGASARGRDRRGRAARDGHLPAADHVALEPPRQAALPHTGATASRHPARRPDPPPRAVRPPLSPQVAPQDYELERSEPLLTCVTDPMKSVTKLGRYGRASSSSSAPDAPAPTPPSASDLNSLKRK